MTIGELINYLELQIELDKDNWGVNEQLSMDSKVYIFDGYDYQPLQPDGELLGGNYFSRGICLHKEETVKA